MVRYGPRSEGSLHPSAKCKNSQGDGGVFLPLMLVGVGTGCQLV